MSQSQRIAYWKAFLLVAATIVTPISSEEDPLTIKNYWNTLQKFDTELRKRTTQEDVVRLCDQFSSHLQKTLKSVGSESEFLASATDRELNRVKQIKDQWINDPQKFARIQLDTEWVQAGEFKEATNDFRRVLGVKIDSPSVTERPELQSGFGDGAQLFGKPWLCPIGEFLGAFSLGESIKPRNARVKVGMPGFPAHSLYYHSFDGSFNQEAGVSGGPFNRMYIVTDKWDRVFAVQFCSESPKSANRAKHSGISIFNFVQFRRKGSSNAHVDFQTDKAGESTKIITNLRDHGKIKEINVLYLPEPALKLVQFNLRQR